MARTKADQIDQYDDDQEIDTVPLTKGLFFTRKGLRRFGKMVVDARSVHSFARQDDLVKEIYNKTGYKLSMGTISNIERGLLAGRQADLISAIAALKIIKHHSEDRPYSWIEIHDVCTERLDPTKQSDTVKSTTRKGK